MPKHKMALIIMIFLTALWMLSQNSSQLVSAQPRITNTPIPVIIPTLTATVPSSDNRFVEASPSPTFTATPELPNAKLVAIVPPSEALVRDFPESGEIIGFLETNREYQVTGQYFSWYQIQFADSPTGRAWVFFQTIRVTGNLEEIPPIDPNSAPAASSFEDNQTQTAVAIFQTPGIAETATAQARILTLPAEEGSGSSSEFLATYTAPADIVPRQATTDPNALPSPTSENIAVQTVLTSVAENGVPPFVPILALGLFGILGLIISLIRR
jgi:hypothetical protein